MFKDNGNKRAFIKAKLQKHFHFTCERDGSFLKEQSKKKQTIQKVRESVENGHEKCKHCFWHTKKKSPRL